MNGLYYSLSSLDSSKGHFSKYTKRKGHAIYLLSVDLKTQKKTLSSFALL
jgi:hypothetical protein